jgi:hypothetical protein
LTLSRKFLELKVSSKNQVKNGKQVKTIFWFKAPGVSSADVDQSGREGVVQLAGLPSVGDMVSIYIFDGSEYIETLWVVTGRAWSTSDLERFDVEIHVEPTNSEHAEILSKYSNAKLG